MDLSATRKNLLKKEDVCTFHIKHQKNWVKNQALPHETNQHSEVCLVQALLELVVGMLKEKATTNARILRYIYI